jgi:hypothetical protein
MIDLPGGSFQGLKKYQKTSLSFTSTKNEVLAHP